mgnify:CR=1 FL=1
MVSHNKLMKYGVCPDAASGPRVREPVTSADPVQALSVEGVSLERSFLPLPAKPVSEVRYQGSLEGAGPLWRGSGGIPQLRIHPLLFRQGRGRRGGAPL